MSNLDSEILSWVRIAKGDVTGHDFHGNQYQTVASGGSPSAVIREAHRVAGLLQARAQRNEPEISREIKETCQQFSGTQIKPDKSVKGADSIERKLILDSKEYLDTAKGSVQDAAANMGDTVRYTIQYPTDKFTEGVSKTLADFKTEGFEAVKVKNFFNDDPENSYRGINCVFRDTASNQMFEVQFHTPESGAMVSQVHPLYESARLLDPSTPEYTSAQKNMISMWQAVPIPAGVESIGKLSVKR
jgi:hypothetical protein